MVLAPLLLRERRVGLPGVVWLAEPGAGGEVRQFRQPQVHFHRDPPRGQRAHLLRPSRFGRVAQEAERDGRIGVGDHLRRTDPLAGGELDALTREDPGHRHSRRHHGAELPGDVAEEEGDHPHAALHVAPRPRLSEHSARSVMEPHRGRPRIVGARVGTDDTLPQIGEVHPLIVHVPLDHFDHGPLEQDRARFGIATEPALDLVALGRRVEPQIAGSIRAQSVP